MVGLEEIHKEIQRFYGERQAGSALEASHRRPWWVESKTSLSTRKRSVRACNRQRRPSLSMLFLTVRGPCCGGPPDHRSANGFDSFACAFRLLILRSGFENSPPRPSSSRFSKVTSSWHCTRSTQHHDVGVNICVGICKSMGRAAG